MIPDEPWFPLRTERLLLREFRPDDFDDVHEYARDPKVAHFMDWGPNTLEETQAFMQRQFDAQAVWPRAAVNLAAEHVADRKLIGSIRLSVSDPVHLQGDLGYSFNSGYWGHGYATEAARALLAVGFGVLGLHRIWAECNVQNTASWGVMERLGMRREAHILHGKRIKGAWRDGYVYAILEPEFSATQA